MTEFQPGWYPDPDDSNARRYWDGRVWSAPLPTAASAPTPSTPAAQPAPRTCAVATCSEPRAAGLQYCGQHDPNQFHRWAAPRASQTKPSTLSQTVGNASLVCPHCGERGAVTSRPVKVKKGISGSKATGAVLTAGFSVLATGLSKKEKAVERTCGRCRTTWQV